MEEKKNTTKCKLEDDESKICFALKRYLKQTLGEDAVEDVFFDYDCLHEGALNISVILAESAIDS